MTIFLVGSEKISDDSLYKEAPLTWAEALKETIKTSNPEVIVENRTHSNHVLESYLNNSLIDQLSENDVVIIYFKRFDEKEIDFKGWYHYESQLKTTIAAIKEKEASLVLVSSIGDHYSPQNQIIKKISQEEALYFINLQEYDHFLTSYKEALVTDRNQEIARYIHMRLRPFLSKQALFDKYYYGACMYPELWSEEVVKADIQHMKKIGMNYARIGEFIWSSLEPEEGVYNLSFLEQIVSWYQEEEIDLVLCIPTPTPPIWMTANHPERCIHNKDGSVMSHGSRQHACTNNDYYRKKAYQLTRKISKLIKKYDNVIGIQLDNEFKCHVDMCYCPSCHGKWGDWLKDEYNDINQLNEKWGTRIWSEEYLSFEQVPMPLTTPFLHNSSLMNAFRRFTAESLNAFSNGLCHILRMETAVPITHNTAMGFNLLNEDLFHELDYVGFDTYAPAANHPAYTVNLDLWRNLKKNVNEFMLLETSTSHAGHIENYISPHPKRYLVTEIFAGFAAGLKAFTYWHFRGHRYGVEQPHSSVLTAWGEPGSGYDDVVESGQLIEKMRPYLEETVNKQATIGFIYSDDAKRHFNIESGGLYNYRGLVTDYYGSLVRKGLSVEVIQESADLSEFKLIIVPFIRHVSKELLENLQTFINKGGKVIFGPMTGDRNEELALHDNNGLGDLGEWLGLSQLLQFSVHHQPYLVNDESLDRLVTVFETPSDWERLWVAEDSRLVAAKKEEEKGSIIYLGALPQALNESSLWDTFVQKEIHPFDRDQSIITITDDLVKYRRESDTYIQLYLVNMTQENRVYDLNVAAWDVLANKEVGVGRHTLESYDYQILQIEK